MKLDKKKAMAGRMLGVSPARILFIEPRLDEIKEAITKEDIRSLIADGAIKIKPIKAKKSAQKRKVKKSPGNIKINVKNRKQKYMILTRKLRRKVLDLKSKNLLTKEQTLDIRNKIRNKYFKNKTQLNEFVATLEK
jgi:large subunit ribosomal protein L19e